MNRGWYLHGFGLAAAFIVLSLIWLQLDWRFLAGFCLGMSIATLTLMGRQRLIERWLA